MNVQQEKIRQLVKDFIYLRTNELARQFSAALIANCDDVQSAVLVRERFEYAVYAETEAQVNQNINGRFIMPHDDNLIRTLAVRT